MHATYAKAATSSLARTRTQEGSLFVALEMATAATGCQLMQCEK